MSVLEKVAALLAKADSSEHEAEADAYVAKAQQLATLHAIDVETARRHSKKKHAASTPVQRQLTIGEPRKHANKQLVRLFLSLASANDVKCDIAVNSTYVIAFGLPDDIDMCEALWVHLAPRMTAAAAEFVRAGSWRGELAVRWNGSTPVFRPLTTAGARAAFCDAFSTRVSERLTTARQNAIDEIDLRHRDAGSPHGAADESAALVLAEKSATVRAFHARQSKARGSWSGYSGTRAFDDSNARTAGRQAGDTVKLRADPALGGKREIRQK
ncbi:MAG: DUF2786 domain-containing protein [Actinomycetes bacterium]